MDTTDYDEWRQRWPALVVQRRTEEAAELLDEYYATTDAGLPAYSGSQFEAIAALDSNPYSIGPADFTAVSMLSVNVPAQPAIRLLGRDSAKITDLLTLIPLDRDIIDVDPSDLEAGSAASQLWQVLRRGDGLGPTTTSKLIAAKRPRLIPIWDSFVHQATGLFTVGYWQRFQQVLKADDHAIWTWLTELRQHCTNVPADIPNLRFLDVLLWMTIKRESAGNSR